MDNELVIPGGIEPGLEYLLGVSDLVAIPAVVKSCFPQLGLRIMTKGFIQESITCILNSAQMANNCTPFPRRGRNAVAKAFARSLSLSMK